MYKTIKLFKNMYVATTRRILSSLHLPFSAIEVKSKPRCKNKQPNKNGVKLNWVANASCFGRFKSFNHDDLTAKILLLNFWVFEAFSC